MSSKSAKLWMFMGILVAMTALAGCGDGVTDDVAGTTAGADAKTGTDAGLLDSSDAKPNDTQVADAQPADTPPVDVQNDEGIGADMFQPHTLVLTAPTKGQIVNPQAPLQVKGSLEPNYVGEDAVFEVTDENGVVLLSGDVTDTSKIAVDLSAPATPGTHKWTITVKGKTSGKVIASSEINFVVNSLPTAPQVSIQPQTPSTLDPLQAQLDVPAQDADGQALTYTYAWSKNGQPTGQTGATLPAGTAKKGEIWTVTVTASDGVGQGPSASASVTIGNAAPVAAVLAQLAAFTPLDGTIAVTQVSPPSDADGDPLTTVYVWQVGGVTVPGITGPQATIDELALALGKPIKTGDVVSVTAQTSDGTATSTSQSVSTSVSIAAQCPFVAELPPHAVCVENGTTSPGVICDKLSLGDGLLCVPVVGLPQDSTPVIPSNTTLSVQLGTAGTSTDGPFDVEITDETGALIGSALLPSLEATQTVEAKPAHPGLNQVTVTVKVGGKLVGTWTSSVYVNTAPTAPEVAIQPNPALAGADLKAVITAPATDVDTSLQQPLTYAYAWAVDGQLSNYTGESLPAGVIKKGQLWQVSVTASDGVEAGLPGVATLTVGNTAPETPLISTESASVGLLGKIVVSQSNPQASDVDGDPVTTTFAWQVDGVTIPAAAGSGLTLVELANGGAKLQVGSVISITATASDGTATATSLPVAVTVSDADAICPSVLSPCALASICNENGSFAPVCSCPTGSIGDGTVCVSAVVASVGLAGEVTQVGLTTAIGAGAKKPLTLQILDSTGTVVASVALTDGGQTLDAKLLAGNQQWTLQILDVDGKVVASDTRAIFGDTPPSAPVVTLGPANPTTLTGVLLVAAISSDPDVDQVLTYSYSWSKNGQPTGITTPGLLAGAVKKGELWLLEVVASDGIAVSLPGQATVLIGNASPSAFNVNLPAKVQNLDPLTAVVAPAAKSDADGDPLTYAAQWFIDGEAVPGATGLTLNLLKVKLTSGKPIKVGAQVTCTVTASDGAASTTATSDVCLVDAQGGDVCKIFNPCDANAVCVNNGTLLPTCTCKTGYSGDGLTCSDVNECLTANGGCAATATCTNSAGSFSCACNAGYTGDGKTCTDVNECLTANGGCSANGTCTNSAGSFSCACKTGYTGDGKTCTDVNECLTANGGCAATATCTNSAGSFSCACNAGYTGDGKTCSDVNECLTANGGCSANGTCTNSVGSFSCACKTGFTGDGKTCTDINECLTANGGCAATATCTNTSGSFSCACNAGYTGDGKTCSDINECLTNNGGCSANATCTNSAGSFSCACKTGYTGDGKTCTDVNECLTNNGGCSVDADCTNTAGSFTCACKKGLTGNGLTCSPDGCADGTREGFVAASTFPNIAGCSGGWSVAGLLPSTAAKCALGGGNSGSNPNGTGCSAADLCQTGWHICATATQVKNASPTGTCTGVTATGAASLFFATLQSGPGSGTCDAASTNDIFGCGNLGAAPDPGTCAPLNAFGSNVCGALSAPWSCPSSNGGFDEAATVVKPGPLAGGVLCCRN